MIDMLHKTNEFQHDETVIVQQDQLLKEAKNEPLISNMETFSPEIQILSPKRADESQDDGFLLWNEDQCHQCLAKDPKNLKALFRQGMICLSKSQTEQALANFQKVAEIDQHFMKVHVCMKLGETYYKMDQQDP